MKTIKVLFLQVIVLLFINCTASIDLDDEDEIGKITVNAIGDNADGSVSIGGNLELEISLFDRDNIAFSKIEIPALSINILNEYDAEESSININQTFSVAQVDTNELKIIVITMTDKDGFVYTQETKFVLK